MALSILKSYIVIEFGLVLQTKLDEPIMRNWNSQEMIGYIAKRSCFDDIINFIQRGMSITYHNVPFVFVINEVFEVRLIKSIYVVQVFLWTFRHQILFLLHVQLSYSSSLLSSFDGFPFQA